MKLMSFVQNGNASFGLARESGVVDLKPRYPEAKDLRDVLRLGHLETLLKIPESAPTDFSLTDIIHLPVIPNPEKIICIGVNYADRNAEYRDGSTAPKYPSVFMRSRESLVGHGQPLMLPPESEQLDYEGEIALVIGKEGRRIPQSAAHEYIAGVSIMNEGSIRDYLRHAKFNVTQGKNFEQSGALGPFLVTSDELDPMSELRVQTHVNGELRQNDTTNSLMFPFAYLISYLSTFFRLKPGDIIATGTPNGAGARLDPPQYLTHGDRVSVSVSGVGVLENPVLEEVL